MVLRTTEQFFKVLNSQALFPKIFDNGKSPEVKIEKLFWLKCKTVSLTFGKAQQKISKLSLSVTLMTISRLIPLHSLFVCFKVFLEVAASSVL